MYINTLRKKIIYTMLNNEINFFFNYIHVLSYLLLVFFFSEGVIGLLEEALQRPLRWFASKLHVNKLHLRHLLAKIDGKTVGSQSVAEPLGKLLASCENLAIVKFEQTANLIWTLNPLT